MSNEHLHDVFPLDPSKIEWTSKIKPKWEVTSYESAGQGRKSLIHHSYPKWQFDITFPRLSATEVDTLLAFHAYCKGSWMPFYYKDYERHTVTGLQLPVVNQYNGSWDSNLNKYTYYAELQAQIVTYAGTYPSLEPCYMFSNIKLYLNGTRTTNFTLGSSYGADYDGLIWPGSKVSASDVLTADYDYYYRCIFDSSITINQKFKNFYSVSLKLQTVQQVQPNTLCNYYWQGGVPTKAWPPSGY